MGECAEKDWETIDRQQDCTDTLSANEPSPRKRAFSLVGRERVPEGLAIGIRSLAPAGARRG